MSVSLADSLLWSGLYGDAELAVLLDDAALLAAMDRVEVALAEGCAAAGLIPTEAGHAIAIRLEAVEPDPGALSEAAARWGAGSCAGADAAPHSARQCRSLVAPGRHLSGYR